MFLLCASSLPQKQTKRKSKWGQITRNDISRLSERRERNKWKEKRNLLRDLNFAIVAAADDVGVCDRNSVHRSTVGLIHSSAMTQTSATFSSVATSMALTQPTICCYPSPYLTHFSFAVALKSHSFFSLPFSNNVARLPLFACALTVKYSMYTVCLFFWGLCFPLNSFHRGVWGCEAKRWSRLLASALNLWRISADRYIHDSAAAILGKRIGRCRFPRFIYFFSIFWNKLRRKRLILYTRVPLRGTWWSIIERSFLFAVWQLSSGYHQKMRHCEIDVKQRDKAMSSLIHGKNVRS